MDNAVAAIATFDVILDGSTRWSTWCRSVTRSLAKFEYAANPAEARRLGLRLDGDLPFALEGCFPTEVSGLFVPDAPLLVFITPAAIIERLGEPTRFDASFAIRVGNSHYERPE